MRCRRDKKDEAVWQRSRRDEGEGRGLGWPERDGKMAKNGEWNGNLDPDLRSGLRPYISYLTISSRHFFDPKLPVKLGTPVFQKIAIQKIGFVKMVLLLLFLAICVMFPDFGRGVWQGFWGDDD